MHSTGNPEFKLNKRQMFHVLDQGFFADPDPDFKKPDPSVFCFSLSFLTNNRDLKYIL